MRRSTYLRRACAATASAGLAAGLAWLPAGPASALVKTELVLQGAANLDTGACPVTSGGNKTIATPLFSHGKRTRSLNFSATFTNTGDPSDTVQASGHYRATWAVAKKGADLHKVSLTGSGTVSLDVAKGAGTGCGDPSAVAEGGGILQFTEHHDGWFYVERTTPAIQGVAVTEVQNSATDAPVQLDLFQGGASHAVSRGFSKAGPFNAEIFVGVTTGNTGLAKRAPHSSISMVFYRTGSALTGTKGAGKSYLAFPRSVSCGAHQATLRWKSRAGHVAAGSFLVNGKKKASDGSPKGGEKIVLKHLKSTADITLTAKLRLENGGSATATRSYVPCKG